jgi:SAM-dependent methyltransferase
MMRKRYLHDECGEGREFWDRSWDRDWQRKYSEAPIVDRRLVRHIDRYLTEDMLLLEGGCGDAQYVRHFTTRGYRVVGVDFSERTVRKVNELLPQLDVRVGDITNLDLPEDRFDAYYSGGVIEHFEEGVDKQMSEARRVLKPGGYLFVTVPHLNIVRRLSSRLRATCYKIDLDGRRTCLRENVLEFRIEPPPPGFHFHEYVFSTQEMRRFLAGHGFRVIDEVAFSGDWGLLDVQFYYRAVGVGKAKRLWLNKICAAPLRVIRYCDRKASLAARLASALAGELMGNLKLYVCRNEKRTCLAHDWQP